MLHLLYFPNQGVTFAVPARIELMIRDQQAGIEGIVNSRKVINGLVCILFCRGGDQEAAGG
jgi:hypothetical protein